MIELSNYRQIHTARRAPGTASATAARAATVIAALGAAALLPLVAQPAMAAPPVQQAASPPARAGQAAPGGTAFAGTPQDAAALVHTALGAMAKAPRVIPAVEADVWNDLAMCESSGNWHINSGNGFYGGLQFWQPTWEAFGGTRYARRADLANRAHQISIARSVLREQGWRAWPVCSRKLRLSDTTPAAGGTAGRPPQTGATAPGQAPAKIPAKIPGKAPAADPGKVVDGPAATATDQTDGKNRATHTVLPGETLSGIARAAHVRGGWKRLYAVNKQAIGPDPDRLQAGVVLTMP
ncbi:transglycosylase family protein [Streptomyces sp. V4-01]|uniref:Transglycosylase family protein n=1 Tax=Actinacidiphila polyblastidii TaxID=3110430 RepID=A0ABU7PK31_9ACTN|nr:transglycosylase family protein [Streptomyces sp. V4-01]